ncbi:MAG: asparagine synthase (glutamine-hydrolyzing) [Desulfomonilia bacterium]
MCRIAGIWSRTPRADLRETCLRMRDAQTRGGPDDAGVFIEGSAGIALGHRRLSIIDLSTTGHQPMTSTDGRFTLSYNGEVYNYRELREDLEAQGVTFRGTSDSEVVLNAFARWGTSCVTRFIGMFAFAIWDSLHKTLFLYRDRMGVKPLYYHCHDGVFVFASELKAIHSVLGSTLQIDSEALGEFFHYGYISSPRSIFKHTHKLEPGCCLTVTADHDIRKEFYWSLPAASTDDTFCGDENTIIDELEELMIDAFAKRLIADVPVGVFLSGGIDSSLVTALLARHTDTPIRTFTIGFKEKNYDESPWAKHIASYLGTEHTEEIVTPDHAKEILPLWPEIYDEPFGDISGIPTTIVSRMTREHVKVSLSADGGDELFCGYHRYWVMERLNRFIAPLPAVIPRLTGALMAILGNERVTTIAQAHPKLRLPAISDRMRKFQAVLNNWTDDARSAYPYAVGYWLPDEIRLLTGGYADPRPPLDEGAGSLLNSMMIWDMVHYLPEDICAKVDRATMYCSLEGRDPFLDHRIVEFALRTPLELKYKSGSMKYLLRRLLSRYLPEHLFTRPKQGFAVPIYSWLHDDLINLVDDLLSQESLMSQHAIDPDIVEQTVSRFRLKGGSVAVDRIWLLLVYMMWHRRYCS